MDLQNKFHYIKLSCLQFSEESITISYCKQMEGKLSFSLFITSIHCSISQTVDFVVGPIAISEDRQKYVDFAQPYWVDPNIILVQKPDLASSNIFLCFGPFSPGVWALICLSVIGGYRDSFPNQHYHPMQTIFLKGNLLYL